MSELHIELSEAQSLSIENLNKAAAEMIKSRFSEKGVARDLLELAYKMGFIDCLKVQNHTIIANLRTKSG